MRKKVRVYLPENLDIDELLKSHPSLELNRNNLIYVAGLVYGLPEINHHYLKANGFTKLNSDILKAKMRNYKRYLKYLIATGVLKCDGEYGCGQSLGYGFTESYHGIKACEIEIDVRGGTQIRNTGTDTLTKKHYHLIRWLEDGGLQIDYDKAIQLLDRGRKTSEGALVNNLTGKDQYPSLMNYKPGYMRTYTTGLVATERIRGGDHRFTVDESGLRLHTLLTSLNRNLRNFLTYKGHKLVGLDVSNSQPYFSLCLFKESFYKKDAKSVEIANSSIDPHRFNAYTIYNTAGVPNPLHSSLSMFMGQQVSNLIGNQDIRLYAELASSGMFYERLEAEFRFKNGLTFPNRGALKQMVFIVLFSDNRYIGQNEEGAALKRLFRDLFPNVSKVFSALKKNDSAMLPRLLQAIESHIILRVVCKKLSEERPDVPLFTIHDNIATTEENVEYVLDVMIKELEQHVGYFPTIKVEPWF